ncbi:MAG: succinylglutamate desuccinylase/aspartoacylase family protein [Pseudomonadales bacterium]|nr:succinylglutamate desuccinylase/aspartoacylase family protein [Pseudomonadales bacterium]
MPRNGARTCAAALAIALLPSIGIGIGIAIGIGSGMLAAPAAARTPDMLVAPPRLAPPLHPTVTVIPPARRTVAAPPPGPADAVGPTGPGLAPPAAPPIHPTVTIVPVAEFAESGTPDLEDPARAHPAPVEVSLPEPAALRLLGQSVTPGTFAMLAWEPSQTFASGSLASTVLVAHGARRGPVLCLTAAVHGDELNGIETVRRILHDLDPTELSGTVIGVPIVNIQGFNRGSRYLPDRRDLNRFFPGNPSGSSASRIAHSLFYNVIVHCNSLVDLHTGSFHRTNLPQLRANLNDPGSLTIAEGFGATVVLHSPGEEGTLRWAATQAGIPAVTLEAGGPMQVQQEAVAHSVRGIQALMQSMGMHGEQRQADPTEPVYYQSRWVRADHGGILSGKVPLGHQVAIGDLLGTVIDPLTNQQQQIRSPFRGRVIGMALDQFVMPGYATFHIGIESAVEDALEAPVEPESDYEAAEVEPDIEQH